VRFYLGTHEPIWLARTDVPLFLSRRRLSRQQRWPRARGPWALDSGGFSELSLFGRWDTTAAQYVAEVRRWQDEIGGLEWAAIQDWMCEPSILAKTGKSVIQHQERTLYNYADLLHRAPDLPWRPVIQGWAEDDYKRHVEGYVQRGLPIWDRVVGIGSVCRRQGDLESRRILRRLANFGLRLHGFGLKATGLAACAGLLESADSMAWSLQARKQRRQPTCGRRSCANCLHYALAWRDRLVDQGVWPQADLFTEEAAYG